MADKKGIRAGKNKTRGKYTAQRIRTERNKTKRRKLHLSKHPNDLQGKKIIRKLEGVLNK